MGRPIPFEKLSYGTTAPYPMLWFLAMFSGESTVEDSYIVKQLGPDTFRLKSAISGRVEDFVLISTPNTQVPGQATLMAYKNPNNDIAGYVVKFMRKRVNVMTESGIFMQYQHNFGFAQDPSITEVRYAYFDAFVLPTAFGAGDWDIIVTGSDVSLDLLDIPDFGSVPIIGIDLMINGVVERITEVTDFNNTGTYLFAEGVPDGDYTYRIRSVSGAGVSPWSAEKTVTAPNNQQ